MNFTRADYEKAAHFIQQKISIKPRIGLILGSGLGPLADAIENAVAIPFGEIPGMPQSTVQGHAGRMVIGTLEGQPVMAMQGRIHFYEGHTMHEVAFPVRVMQMMGIETLIVTNAAGGLNPDFRAGDLMLLNDHINLLGMMGWNPLMGHNDESLGTRFPPMTIAYDKPLRDLAMAVARREGLTLREGVYICLSGPTFETPADSRMIRSWGADAVGMSTVPEVIAARHGGMRVMGISSIVNMVIMNTESNESVSHEEVLAMGKTIVPRLTTLLRGVLRDLPPK